MKHPDLLRILLSLVLLTAAGWGCGDDGDSTSSQTTSNGTTDTSGATSTPGGTTDTSGGTTSNATGQAPSPLTPAQGSMSGYIEVTLDLSDLGVDASAVDRVQMGATRWILLEAVDGQTLRGITQGHPTAETVDVELFDSSGASLAVVEEAFTYAPPLDPRFERFAAFGASLGQGVQSGSPNFHGALVSPSAQLARQVGAYHPLPLFVPGLFPALGVDDISPPPACLTPSVGQFLTLNIGEVLDKLTPADGDTSQGFALARVDPDLTAYNVSVGGSTIRDTIQGAQFVDFAVHLVGNMVYNPYGELGSTAPYPQIEALEMLQPTLVMTTDLFGNDLIGSLVGLGNDEIELDDIPPVEEFEADLDALVTRLERLDTWAFIANMPRPTLLPAALTKRNLMIDAARQNALDNGEDPEQAALDAALDADDRLAQIDAITEAYNQQLADRLEGLEKIHLVDLAARVAELEQNRLMVDGVELSV
ncbi:MAG: hypothetical protein AAFX99_35060, partial [Myxococcota bacterium]